MDLDRDLARFQQATRDLEGEIRRVIVGQDRVVREILVCLLAGGHALLEGAPGLGKTLLVRTLARSLRLAFSRIQFTPDLMPADVTGTNVIVEDAGGRKRFEFQPGPIFGNIVLADEINRATPKTQSALLEAMQERAVTVAGTRHPIEPPFFVLATENPIEMEGTYPLPEAQLDRFLYKILVPDPDEATLARIVEATTGAAAPEPRPVLDGPGLLAMLDLVRRVPVAEPLVRYAARFVRATQPESADASASARKHLRYGAGVRGAQALVLAAKAEALLKGRVHVAFEDLRAVAKPALRHRLILNFEGEASGIAADEIIDAVLAGLPEMPAEVSRLGS
ncbi:MAG: AAA family ATPase [Planctomycetes bacterium]|nr:AAA family ATPase [Planctomycetota bacterium]